MSTTLTPALATIAAVGGTADYLATHSGAAEVSAAAASASTAIAKVYPVEDLTEQPSSQWELVRVTKSTPGGNAPSGTAITRITEDGTTGWRWFDLWTTPPTSMAAGRYRMCIEYKTDPTYAHQHDWTVLQFSEETTSKYVTFYVGDGAEYAKTTATTYEDYDLGDGWRLAVVDVAAATGGTVEPTILFRKENVGSYLGDVTHYIDFGKAWTERVPTVTAADGTVTVRAYGVADGDTTLTATLDGEVSSASTVNVGGIAGDLAVTESGADTAAMAGESWFAAVYWLEVETANVTIAAGDLAVTETGSDTAALAGDVVVQGNLVVAESGADTAALAGDVVVQGNLVVAESGADTFAGGVPTPAPAPAPAPAPIVIRSGGYLGTVTGPRNRHLNAEESRPKDTARAVRDYQDILEITFVLADIL